MIRSLADQVEPDDPKRPHHFVVLVLYDVTVPDELTGSVELSSKASHLAGICDHRVFETRLPFLWRTDISSELDRNYSFSIMDFQSFPVKLQRSLRGCAWDAHLQ